MGMDRGKVPKNFGYLPEPAYEWLNERIDMDSFMETLLGKPVPPWAQNPFYCMGGLVVVTFVVQVLSGIFLGFFYEPSTQMVQYPGWGEVPAAFASNIFIDTEVPFGLISRRIHYWGANFMVAAIVLHASRVFFTGAYRKPREGTYLIGLGLLGMTLLMGFLGYSLPYSNLGVTATRVGYSMANSIPLIGDQVAYLLFAGAFGNPDMIPRMFFLHVMAVPFALVGLMMVHFVLIRKHGIKEPM